MSVQVIGAIRSAHVNEGIASQAALGGGVVQLPGRDIICDAPIDLCHDRVTLQCAGETMWSDAGVGWTAGTRFIRNFDNAPLLRIRSPYGAGNAKKRGAEIIGGMLDGARRPGPVLEIDSVSSVKAYAYVTGAVSTEAAVVIKAGVTGQDLAEACDVQDSQVELFIRQFDTPEERAVNCASLVGSINANPSHNKGGAFLRFTCLHGNGRALHAPSADNNAIVLRSLRYPGCTGASIWAGGRRASAPVGCEANTIAVSCDAPVYAEGTNDAGVTGGVFNVIEPDRANGTPTLVAGLGSLWIERGQRGELVNHALVKAAIGDSAAAALAARDAMGAETVRIFNGSAAHVILQDWARRWLVRLAGNDLDVWPLDAAGHVNIPGLRIGGVAYAPDANGFLKAVP